MSHADAFGLALKAAVDGIADPSTFATYDLFSEAVWKALAHELLAVRGYAEIAMSADQTARIANGNHIEFNLAVGPLVDSGDVSISTGTGQALGDITIKAGKTYRIEAYVRPTFSTTNSGNVRIQINDAGGGGLGGEADVGVAPLEMRYLSGASPSAWGEATASVFYWTPATDKTFSLDFQSVANVLDIQGESRVIISRLA